MDGNWGFFILSLRDDHPESVLSSMQTIMVVLLEESEEVQGDLLCTILSTLSQGKNVSVASFSIRRRSLTLFSNKSLLL